MDIQWSVGISFYPIAGIPVQAMISDQNSYFWYDPIGNCPYLFFKNAVKIVAS